MRCGTSFRAASEVFGADRGHPDHDVAPALWAWQQVLAGVDAPTLVDPSAGWGMGARGVASFRVPEETTRALG